MNRAPLLALLLSLAGCLPDSLPEPVDDNCPSDVPDAHPDALDICGNGLDENCDGIDEDCRLTGAIYEPHLSSQTPGDGPQLVVMLDNALGNDDSEVVVARNNELRFLEARPAQNRFQEVETIQNVLVSDMAAGEVLGGNRTDLVIGSPDVDDLTGVSTVWLLEGNRIASKPMEELFPGVINHSSDSTFGFAVDIAGDFNGDTHPDLVVGSPSRNSIYLIFGPFDDGEPYEIEGDTPPDDLSYAIIAGPLDVADAGRDVAGAGDLNGDGLDEILVSSAGNGTVGAQVALIYGQPTTDNIDNDIKSIPSILMSPDVSFVVAGPGDVNGDGYDEAMIAHPQMSLDPTQDDGVACVFYGNDTAPSPGPGPMVQPFASGNADCLLGGGLGARLGADMSGAGDVNGDGFADVLLGAPGLPTGQNQGAVFLVLGPIEGMETIEDRFDAQIVGPMDGDELGRSVSGGGDLNGDGYADFATSGQMPEVWGFFGGP